MEGSTPATAILTIFAIGCRSNIRTASSLASSNNAAPSFNPDEFPAVTVPFGTKAAFVPNGTVTAGNSSGLNDGAALLLLASEEAVRMFDLQPMAKIVSMAVAGVDPSIMGMAPVPASQKALRRAGI